MSLHAIPKYRKMRIKELEMRRERLVNKISKIEIELGLLIEEQKEYEKQKLAV